MIDKQVVDDFIEITKLMKNTTFFVKDNGEIQISYWVTKDQPRLVANIDMKKVKVKK